MATLTQADLKRRLSYNPETGVFVWILPNPRARLIKAGDVAGSDNGDGYRRIGIDGKYYLAHRLAWLYVTGVWPENEIDHINRTTGDNRIANLREANKSQNMGNAPARHHNASGFRGVSWHAVTHKWVAQIKVRHKSRYLGLFETAEAAATAYEKAAKEHFGEFYRSAPHGL